jgi:hypothetical protein
MLSCVIEKTYCETFSVNFVLYSENNELLIYSSSAQHVKENCNVSIFLVVKQDHMY